MGLPLPKTPLIAVLSQIIALIFGIICFIPGQNGVLEGAYILSLNTSMYGNDALQTSNMFYLNNSNPMFAVMTSLHPDFEHLEPPPAIKGLNDAIMRRLEINMSDPKTAKSIYDTPLKDVISGGKDLVNGEEGQWKIASGMADFINGMAKQISEKMPPAGAPPTIGAPHPPARRATTVQVVPPNQAAVPIQAPIPLQAPNPMQAPVPNQASVPIQAPGTLQAPVPNQAAVPIQAPGTLQAPVPNQAAVPLQASGSLLAAVPPEAPGPILAPQALESSPISPQTPDLNAPGFRTPGNNSIMQCPKNCVPAPPPKGDPFGPPKPKPVIPATGPWTPVQVAMKEHGTTIANAVKHGAIKAMNAQTDTFRKAVPIYDFYNIYNTGVCWGLYKPNGPQTIGCGSSADWHNIDIAPRMQTLINKLVSPGAKIIGPIGLGPNMERFLATSRILLLIMYINKVMTIVNQAFAMAIPMFAISAMMAGMLPPRLHLKLSFINFAASAAASVAVLGGTMSVLGMMLGMGLTMPPMNAIMSIEMRLGVPYILLCLVDSIFAVVGTVCWYKIWNMMKQGEKQQAEQEKSSLESRDRGKVEVVQVQPNKDYDITWVKG